MDTHKVGRDTPSNKVTLAFLFTAVLLTILSYYVGSKEAIDKGTSSSANIWLFLAALLVGGVAFCLSCIDIGAAKKGYRWRRIIFTLSIPFIGFGSLLTANQLFFGQVNDRRAQSSGQSVVNAVSQPVKQDPEILSLIQSIGAKGDYSNLNMKWSEGDRLSDCGWKDATGCYRGNGTMHVLTMKRSADVNILKTIAAHEYLHYTWHKNNLDNDKQLTSKLIDFYAKNPPFQNRVSSHYVDSGSLNPGEFFSYGCTEISDVRLGDYLATRCNEYINTTTLPALY